MIFAIIIPDHALLLEAAQQAAAAHLYLITNGRRTALSPVIPPGWSKLSVSIKRNDNREVLKCAAS